MKAVITLIIVAIAVKEKTFTSWLDNLILKLVLDN